MKVVSVNAVDGFVGCQYTTFSRNKTKRYHFHGQCSGWICWMPIHNIFSKQDQEIPLPPAVTTLNHHPSSGLLYFYCKQHRVTGFFSILDNAWGVEVEGFHALDKLYFLDRLHEGCVGQCSEWICWMPIHKIFSKQDQGTPLPSAVTTLNHHPSSGLLYFYCKQHRVTGFFSILDWICWMPIHKIFSKQDQGTPLPSAVTTLNHHPSSGLLYLYCKQHRVTGFFSILDKAWGVEVEGFQLGAWKLKASTP
ncbi:hypothetical protein QE152_g26841 [Popillia japonica]|uniref:F-box protein n=1 Tax=Popillia japonica TaxID=7064 RepID=A0AAW1JWD7_POPJA